MVRYICITNSKKFQVLEHRIISLEEFADRETGLNKKTNSVIFNDMTTNFEDLDYWNSKKDLDGKNVRQVEKRIQEIIRNLNDKGFTMRRMTLEDEDSITTPNWMWGHSNKNSGKSDNLSDDERISILMFHLNNLLTTLQEYDNEFNTFLDPR
jgi:exonuclease III